MKTKLIFKAVAIAMAMLLAGTTYSALAQYKAHVYINPGHGGHDSDDRNVVVAPFVQGDTAGFWESNSNLRKGNFLSTILKRKGYRVSQSRVTNTTADDLPLSTIVALSNNSGADIFISIHSNATGTDSRANYPMGLYRGYTGQPEIAGSDILARTLDERLIKNQATYWTNNYVLYGDWTFYPQWGDKVGLGVLRGNKVVSMLSEGSFHDYIPEAYRLLNADYCWLEAWNFSLGIDDYFGNTADYALGAIAGNLRDDRRPREGAYKIFGDDKRMPVCGATVILLNSAGDEVDRVVTDQYFNGIYAVRFLSPGTYTVVVQSDEFYRSERQVVVAANDVTYANFDLKRVRNTPPEVVSYSPVWREGAQDVLCNVPLVFNFNWDMDKESTEQALVIEPAIEGTFRWEDTNYRMVFEPSTNYQPNTLYTVTLKASASHPDGLAMTNDFTFQFRTTSRQYIDVKAVFPKPGDKIHYKSPTIEIRTDSLLATANIFDYVIVRDSQNNQLTLNRRSYKANKRGDAYGFLQFPVSTAMKAGEQYTVSFARELCDTAGIKLEETIVNTFTAVDMAQEPTDEPVAVVSELDDAAAVTVSGDVAPTVTAVTDKLFGTKAIQAKYTFGEALEQFVVEPTPNPEVTFAMGDVIGLYVNGDFSFNTVAAVFDIDGEDDAVPIAIVDFHGWKYIEKEIDYLLGKTLPLKGIALIKNEGPMGASGTVKFDRIVKAKQGQAGGHADVNGDGEVNVGDVSAVYTAILDNTAPEMAHADVNVDGQVNVGDVSAVYDFILNGDIMPTGVKLRYTTGDEYAVASAPTPISGIELVDHNGRVVVRNAANYLNMSQVPAGAYVARIYTAGSVASLPLIK